MVIARFLPTLAAIAMLTLGAGAASAEVVYSATLDGATSGTSSSAVGTGTLVLNDARTAVAYEITFTGLEGTETGAHFHYGIPGAFGPRLLTLLPGSSKSGVWDVDAFDLEQLEAGLVYVNIHTDLFPSGEIRGDFTQGVVAEDAPSWGAVKALYR